MESPVEIDATRHRPRTGVVPQWDVRRGGMGQGILEGTLGGDLGHLGRLAAYFLCVAQRPFWDAGMCFCT